MADPISQFQEFVDIDEVLDARPIASPLRMKNCCPIIDGASAAIIVSDSFGTERGLDAPVAITGSGHAEDTIALHDRRELARTRAAEKAASEAYDTAGIAPEDVDVCEVHDCFTIAEILAIESLGFVDRGEGAKATADGETSIGGRIPVNTSGGLVAKGHLVGATGVAQVVEIVNQLRGRHPTQVEGATVGVTHNVGGSGASAVVHVLEGRQ